MFIVSNYTLAVLFCVITMICWGSWGNTQKLVSKKWRYELFYWDYVIGMFILTLILGLTMGSHGQGGRSFVSDIMQADTQSILWVILGGFIFNASNILLSASVALSGMSVAFPLGVGIALVLGVIINYLGVPSGNPIYLFGGVALVLIAVICNGIASEGMQTNTADRNHNKQGIVIALIAGVLMSLFYRFVVKGMDINDFNHPATGMMTPYSAIFIFSVGVLISNFIFNTLVMRYPFVGERVHYSDYFKGSFFTHLCGMCGGIIWGLGSTFSYIASGQAGPAVSYALGQGAPMIAAIWGVFIWKEFKGASKMTRLLLALMFAFFLCGLSLIVVAGQ